jgi:hypothetical protein
MAAADENAPHRLGPRGFTCPAQRRAAANDCHGWQRLPAVSVRDEQVEQTEGSQFQDGNYHPDRQQIKKHLPNGCYFQTTARQWILFQHKRLLQPVSAQGTTKPPLRHMDQSRTSLPGVVVLVLAVIDQEYDHSAGLDSTVRIALDHALQLLRECIEAGDLHLGLNEVPGR